MRKIELLCLLMLLTIAGMAQKKGILHVSQDGRVETLLQKHKVQSELDSTIDGYRIQIFTEIGNDAVKHSDSVRAVFEENHPDIPIYLSYGQPYYRLRVGDFRSRLEAEKYMGIIKSEHKEAFVTADKINPPVVKLFDDPIEESEETLDE